MPPRAVTALAAGVPAVAVWRNELGGLTFALVGAGGVDRYVKWQPRGTAPGMAAEASRLRWAGRFTPVPEILALGFDDEGEWLMDACPFDWGAAARLARAEREGAGSSAARAALPAPPPVDQLVVCHGDACAPNTLLRADGAWAAHVDLGALGVADRWADLAVATHSLAWNYGPGWDGTLLAAYGVGPDDERTAYYRALWDAT